MTPAEEKALVAQAKGNPQAFGEIFDTYFDPIFHYVLHRVADVAEAEDLTSQTFFNALSHLGRFRWKGVSISAWLYRIATNEVNGHLRKRQRHGGTWQGGGGLEGLHGGPADHRHRPDLELEAAETAFERRKTFLELHAGISELKPDEQTLVVLRYFENKPYGEISRILGKREGSLRMRTQRALKKLKDHLERRGIDHGTIGRPTEKSPGIPGRSAGFPAAPAARSS